MEIVQFFIDFIIHVESHLDYIFTHYAELSYVILFLIIFAETGLIIFPFLPGDSLLFALGAFSARGTISYIQMGVALFIAAVLGDFLNYYIGKNYGRRFLQSRWCRFVKEEHLNKAQVFYEKYGAKTIVLARFMPIIRTFAPFVAGIGQMDKKVFLIYNIFGAFVWIFSFLTLGHFFGNMPQIKENFKLVIVVIIILSILPAVVAIVKEKLKKNSEEI